MKKGVLIILSGPSGVGKGTIREYLMNYDELNLVYSISMTTRTPRNNEKEGEDYFFVSLDEFKENINNNNLLEYAEFCGNYYGTPKNFVEKLLNEGKNVLLEIETNGANQVMQNYKENGLVTIFLMPPSIEELENRIRNRRTETEEIIQKRLTKAKKEMLLKEHYEYVVTNFTPKQTADDIKNIILNNIK